MSSKEQQDRTVQAAYETVLHAKQFNAQRRIEELEARIKELESEVKRLSIRSN